MFEGIVAHLLNKYLGRYIDDLDTEQLNVGIFSGVVHLTDMHLKPEALAELDLPIEVKQGCIAKMSIEIPWTSLYSEPVLVRIEEVLLLAGPVADRKYDPERDKRLIRAQKKARLESTKSSIKDPEGEKPKGFLENLATTIVNNIQVSIQNVHIRYEDMVSASTPFACGLVLQNLTAITTNNKWKATQIDSDAKSIFKLLKVESFSLYWNPSCPSNTLVRAQLQSNGWRTLLRKGLATFSINGEDFDFILKPVSLKMKMILNKSKEAKVPKLLLDFVLQDAACQLSRDQFLSMYFWNKSLRLLRVNQRYRKYFNGFPLKEHMPEWWRAAYAAVVAEYIEPYTWENIKEHRNKYREYKNLYKEFLHRPNDAELKMDLQMQEDKLDVTNILLAREQAKMELAQEEPQLVKKVQPAKSYWSSWFGGDADEMDSSETENADDQTLMVVGEREKSWWARMTSEEKERLFEGIGYEKDSSEPNVPLHYIAHKLNFTLANCTLSLVNNNREILVMTITHFLSSLETRPGGKAFKVSARTESFVVEGASAENELVPILSADHITSGMNSAHVFALDFEKNPLQVKANYGLCISAEPMEVVYYKNAVSELFAFFKLPRAVFNQIKEAALEKAKTFAKTTRKTVSAALEQRRTMHLNVDLKSPYVVIPEHGSLQKSGNVLVIDLGRLTVNSDLQAESAFQEDATKMEAEERLYDRFNITLADAQALFSDSGDEWRDARNVPESDIHLVPKARVVVVFSNSVNPECRTLPRRKLNISIPALKLCLSDRKVSMLAEFAQNVPRPETHLSPVNDAVDSVMTSSLSDDDVCKHTIMDPSVNELKKIPQLLHGSKRNEESSSKQSRSSTEASIHGSLERYYSASEHSDDEECEYWARIVDLPGFEDNVSPSNCIRVLLRFTIGEIAIHLARSSDHVDRPYLMLRAEKLCIDSAMMEYGPAFQASLHRIQLVDKLHPGSSGEYLELIGSVEKTDMITILYRKVRADCPEFKSNFHQVEHSLVVDLNTLSITLHREAFVTLGKFLQYVWAKLKPKSSFHGRQLLSLNSFPSPGDLVLQDSTDPPVPPGATKFSISARVNAVNVKLCGTEMDLADLKIAGLECDYVLKANEKSVLRMYLAEMSLEDLIEETLYSKIISTEEDKVFDIKFVKNSRHHKEIEAKSNALPMKVDGSLRVRFGRVIVVLVQSFINELQRFMEPFINETAMLLKKSTENKLHQQVSELKKSGKKYQLSIDFHAPTFLLPQKPTLPNSLIVSLGDLGVENFFHESQSPAGNSVQYIDNILVRLNSLQVSRAVILLDGKMEIREPIVEPLKLRLDVKRALAPHNKDSLLYEVSGTMDVIKINIGQRDLSTVVAIYQDNYSQMKILNLGKPGFGMMSPSIAETPTSDDSMRKLEVFLYTATDIYKETSFTFIMEGMHVTLYSDGEDIRSLSVRDPLQALSCFELDEVEVSYEMTNDKALELKCSCQSATIIDCHANESSPLRKIFQSYSGAAQSATGVCGISLSMPPMVDLTYRRTSSGDAAVDIVVEKTRLNVSVSYLLAILKFISDALPGKDRKGYLCEDHLHEYKKKDFGRSRLRLPSDSTSGYQSTTSVPEELKALSVSAVFRKPEIILFANPSNMNSEVVVLKMDAVLDYSFNLGQGNFVFSISGLHVLSCLYGRRKQTMCMVLHPCDVEFNRMVNLGKSEMKMLASLSSVNLCFSAPVVHTIIDVVQELLKNVKEEEAKKNYIFNPDLNQNMDLWTPTSVSAERWAESETSPYVTAPYVLPKFKESFLINIPDLQVYCEVSGSTKRIPMLFARASFEAEIEDWSSQLNAKGEFKLEAMYYNEHLSTWEPLLENVMVTEGYYRSLEILFKAFRDCSHPIVCPYNDKDWSCDVIDCVDAPALEPSSSSGEETEEDGCMTVIKKQRLTKMKRISSIAKSRDSLSLLAYPPDSDSENEDGMLEKIASTFDHLFSDGEDGSEDDDFSEESEGIADVGDKSDSGETETADNDISADDRPVFSVPHKEQEDAVDAIDSGYVSESALYFTLDSRDPININITPTTIAVIQEIINDFTSSAYERMQFSPKTLKELSVKNYLGPESMIKFLRKGGDDAYEVVEEVSGRSQLLSTTMQDLVAPLVDISPPDSDSEMSADDTDSFKIASSLVSTEKINLTASVLSEEKSISELYKETTREKLAIEVEGFDKLICLVPKRTTTTMYSLHPVKNKTRYFVMVNTVLSHGERTITVYPPLKVENHLARPVHVLCQKSILEALGAVPGDYSKNPFQDKYVRLTTLEKGQVYNVPLYVAYHCQIYLQPTATMDDADEYDVSSEGIWWQDIATSQRNSKLITCSNVKSGKSKFSIKVVSEANKEIKTPSIGTKLVPNYILHFYPPVVIHNVLPFAVALHFKKDEQTLKLLEGESFNLYDFDLHQTHDVTLEVIQYLGIQWHGKLQLCGDTEEYHPLMMVPETDTCGGNRHLSIHVHTTSSNGNLDIYLFSPYWVVNKTGLPLQFRGSASDVIYEALAVTDPLMFRFKKHKRKKAKLRVYSSHWSKSFNLDTVGNCGVVICTDKERNKKYRFFVCIEMSKLLLTKIITIKPYFLVINNTLNHLRFMEKNDSTDLWFDIAPEKCLPFWPDTDSMKMFVKLRDSKVVSQNFQISMAHETVLRMEHGSALRVEVTCGEDVPTSITFHPYAQGDAPVRVENYCEDLFLKIHQKSQGQVTLINPYKSVLYTWDDPTQERTLIWNLYNRKSAGFPAHIYKDGYGHEKVSFHSLRRKIQPSGSLKSSLEETSTDDDDSEEDASLIPKKTRKDKVVVYWVSYMEKNQRVLLFTQDDRIAKEARKAVDGEKSELEFFLSLSCIGASLINGAQTELAYLSLTSCPAIWEIDINNTWKLLTLELSAWLEDKWTHDYQKAHLKDYLQVDLSKMIMIKPFFGHLRRSYSPAVSLQIRKSQSHLFVRGKVHRLQIDNQLQDAVFPTVMYPGPTPQAVVRRSGPKPCLEFCMLMRKSQGRNPQTVKYLKVLAQEMHLKLDKGFLLSLHDVYSMFKKKKDEGTILRQDLLKVHSPVCMTKTHEPNKRFMMFEYVHLSPVKVYFSFSPRGVVHKARPEPWSLQSDALDFLVNSIGATLSEVKDVELRMAYFEKKGILSSPGQLLSEAKSHYHSQFIQQTYVLILGLDILGNPYGLIKDFTQGLGDLFYEPFMGSVRSPDEFAESLARGTQSLLGHVVGGTAGTVSLITGSLGQALSVLSFDEEYRRKRQQRIQQQNQSALPETLYSAAKSFVMSVTLGLSGVLVQPITGAHQEGVEGFFRGIGKGLLGLITKPAGGVMDLVSMAFDGIRRAAEMGEFVVVRIRLPRYINPTMGLRPYSPYQASGCMLLQLVSKGHYAESDVYWAHAALSRDERSDVALITDKHVFLLEKSRLWGDWNIEWVISIDDIMTVPSINGGKLVIRIKQEDSILNFTGDERYIQCVDAKVLGWLKDQIEKVLLFNVREKPCPADV